MTKRTETKEVSLEKWLDDLYDIKKITDDELNQIYELHRYQGFNRDDVLKELQAKGYPNKLIVEMIIVSAIRGPVKASQQKLSSGRTMMDMGITPGGLKSKKGLTCSRICAATPDLAAYFLKKLNFPKRLNISCPGWLQFPSAGSIKLPQILREQHKEFSIKFSEKIGGEFNESIYDAMIQNSIIDERLKLFD